MCTIVTMHRFYSLNERGGNGGSLLDDLKGSSTGRTEVIKPSYAGSLTTGTSTLQRTFYTKNAGHTSLVSEATAAIRGKITLTSIVMQLSACKSSKHAPAPSMTELNSDCTRLLPLSVPEVPTTIFDSEETISENPYKSELQGALDNLIDAVLSTLQLEKRPAVPDIWSFAAFIAAKTFQYTWYVKHSSEDWKPICRIMAFS